MSYVIVATEMLGAAATDLASLGSTLNAANAAAAAQTTGVLAAAQDQVSAAIAALLSSHGQMYEEPVGRHYLWGLRTALPPGDRAQPGLSRPQCHLSGKNWRSMAATDGTSFSILVSHCGYHATLPFYR